MLLENSVVLFGLKEEKWEEPEPRRELVNKELACLMPGDTVDEKHNKARGLNIEKVERIGNSIQPKAGQWQ